MSMLDAALQIAVRAHAGQKDKAGLPYITHPLRVMARVQGEAAQIVAVLHDVVEDTSKSLDDLRNSGISEPLLAAIALVTHAADVPYADYVVRCKANPVARQVKLADLEENCRLDRALLRADRAARDFARIHRYFLSYRFLTDALTEADYRRVTAEYGELPPE
jgi:hypothetical protein